MTIFESEWFTAEPGPNCDVPGYVVLTARMPYEHLHIAPEEFQTQLGVTLARIEAAIFACVPAERVYVLRYSEILRTVHFHLFPRTGPMAEGFLGGPVTPADAIDGPALFHWARGAYRCEHLSQATLDAAEHIRLTLK